MSCDTFNESLKTLFALFKSLESNTVSSSKHIKEFERVLFKTVNTDPQFVINLIGPYLLSTKDQIITGNDKYFLDKRYDMDLLKFCKEHKIEYDNAKDTIGHMKDVYKGAKSEGQTKIKDVVKNLLIYYAQYLKTLKL